MKKQILVAILLISSVLQAESQDIYKGKIIDKETKESLAFVNIIYNEKNQGVSTNIDGEFFVQASNVKFLKISYIGYISITIENPEKNAYQNIELQSSAFNISEVVVLPGINPAHRIIEKVIENRDINNPIKMRSFSYDSYDKMIFTFDVEQLKSDKKDSISTGSAIIDSSYMRAKKFLDKQHMMLMESVSNRKFIYPDKNSENVIASRISGFKNPSFVMLATQMQSFSFYGDFVTLYEKRYLNPISDGSTNKYFFLLEDTLFTENNDTVFVISFRPKKGKNFDGLKGFLHINTNTYGIQNVKAEPFEKQKIVGIKVQQKYEFIDNKQWFPVELNTDITMYGIAASTGTSSTSVIGIGKTYLQNISLEPELDKSEFSNIELTVEKESNKKDSTFWEQHRAVPLTQKDKNTYHLIDSLGEAENLDLKLKVLEAITNGYIPWSFANIKIDEIIRYNDYEGFRGGIGLMTNEKITKYASLGGYFAISHKDKAMKYCGRLHFNIHEKSESKLKLEYSQDVFESDGYSFFEPEQGLMSTELFREYLISNMDSVETYKASFDFRIFQYFKFSTSLSKNHKIITNNNRYSGSDTIQTSNINYFDYTEVALQLKFAYKEKFMQLPFGKISTGTKYPILWINLKQGIDFLNGEYKYTKYEAKLTKTFVTKIYGKTSLALIGGYTEGNVPYSNLYTGRGNYNKITVESDRSFQTMRLNEFVSDRFVSLYFTQDFGKLLFKTKKFQPEIALVNNMGWGDYTNNSSNIMQTMNKGYFESGIMFNGLLRQSVLSYGIGVYYRYGAYAFSNDIENFVANITLRISL